MRKAALLVCASAALLGAIAAPHGASALTPNEGYYKAPLGGEKSLIFRYTDFEYPKVGSWTIQRRNSDTSMTFFSYPGDGVVHEGRFAWAGHRGGGDVLHVVGEWTARDTVKGTITMPDGTKKDLHATRVANPYTGAATLPPAHQGVDPAAGHYRAPYVSGQHVEFTYGDGQVENFRAGGHTYFASTPVHAGSFTWKSHEHPLLRVAGHWTSSHNVVGIISDQHGGGWDFDAKLQG